MLRVSLRLRLGALIGSMSAAAAFAGCGDLLIPTNDTNDAGTTADGASPDDDGGLLPDGALPDGGAADAQDVDGAPAPLNCADDAGVGHPTQLGCTGLYSDWPSRTISPDAVPYDPGLHLWSDNAEKYRYIYLPPGTKIDTTDLNEWTFPVGTKIWKEFRLLGKKVETRLLWKLAPQTWFRTTYAWSADESSATELIGGATNVMGIGYEIPSTDLCSECHAGRIDMVLGFEIVSLSSPNATGLNMAALKAQNLLTAPPPISPVLPGDPNTVAAMGWLHANCGNACHNRSPSAFAGSTGLFMRLTTDTTGALPSDPRQTDLWTTAVGVTSNFQPAGVPAGTFKRINPGDPSTSAIPYRDARRDGVTQMPPIATHVVDFTDVAYVNAWIKAMPPTP